MKAHWFDPNLNPYVDDLLRLYAAPQSRYTDNELRAMANVIAGKLYEVSDLDRFSMHWGPYALERYHAKSGSVGFEVLFDTVRPRDLSIRRMRSRRNGRLIVLFVGRHGVVEIFNDFAHRLDIESIGQIARAIEAGQSIEIRRQPSAITLRNDSESVRDYDGGFSAPRAQSQLERSGTGGGSQRGDSIGTFGRRDGGGRGRDGGGGDGDGEEMPASGRGGVGELMNHPVLFGIAPEDFASLLEEV